MSTDSTYGPTELVVNNDPYPLERNVGMHKDPDEDDRAWLRLLFQKSQKTVAEQRAIVTPGTATEQERRDNETKRFLAGVFDSDDYRALPKGPPKLD